MIFTTFSCFRRLTSARRFALLLPLLFVATAPSRALGSDTYTFSTIPDDGNISGVSGATIGWGYSITNDSTTDWLLATNLDADSFAYGTPTLLFDFPEVAPGATVTEAFDPIGMTGLYEDVLNASAPNGAVDSGDFDLSVQWYDGDPFNGGTLIGDGVDTDAPYSATANSGSSTPEPSGFVLLASGIAAIVGWRLVRRRQTKHLHTPFVVLVPAIIALGVSTAMAQQGASTPTKGVSDKSEELGITREQADDILSELRQIRQLLERQVRPAAPAPMRAVPQSGKLRLDGGFALGSSDAPVTIVEFSDYQCPFCRQFESTTFSELRKKYIDTGKVRFVVRDFPLVAAHPYAMQAAEAARCADDQGAFWPMHDVLFGDPSKLEQSGLIAYAQSLKLDVSVFRSCLESGKHKAEIQNDMQVAASLQMSGTPSFLIGRAIGAELTGAIIVGAEPISAFEAKIKEVVVH